MVYEIKCSECGKIIDFGGNKPEGLPNNVTEWHGDIFCEECVEELVVFGIGELQERVDFLEEKLEEVLDTLGLEGPGEI